LVLLVPLSSLAGGSAVLAHPKRSKCWSSRGIFVSARKQRQACCQSELGHRARPPSSVSRISHHWSPTRAART